MIASHHRQARPDRHVGEPKKVQRKPLIRYTTGLNRVIVRHGSASASIE